MEPIKINVNVEIGLKQTTIDTLRQIFGPHIISAGPHIELDEEPQPKTATDPAPTPEPEKPKTTGADPVGTGAEDDDDLPEAPAPQATPSENDARQAVKAARDRGVSAKVIKDYMQSTFGIASSVECPAERRAELIKGLANLAA